MAIVDIICPNCGARMIVDQKKKIRKCEYCDSVLPLSTDQSDYSMNDAEKAGYLFEKGRQRARAEQKAEGEWKTWNDRSLSGKIDENMPSDDSPEAFEEYYEEYSRAEEYSAPLQEESEPKEKKGCLRGCLSIGLWILGWICIFPLPLTIIMLKNKKVVKSLPKIVRYIIIACAWLLYLAWEFYVGSDY